jgi:type III pantothenate kinase
MTPDIVVDIGNSRMKWGRVTRGTVAEMVSLSLTDEWEWKDQLSQWQLELPIKWAMAGVNPPVMQRFESWAGNEGIHISNYKQIPLTVDVEQPEQVGIDRLLNAYAALAIASPTVVVGIGTAVTIDLIGGKNVFHGGAILPGVHLQIEALNRGTAKLPELDLPEPASPLPGKSTVEAIRTGVFWSILGAINGLRASFAYEIKPMGLDKPLPVVMTGGDHELFLDDMEEPFHTVPMLTLEGIRLVAERLG